MLYRNTKTGIEFESKSALSAPNIVRVDAELLTPNIEEPSPAPQIPKIEEEVKPQVKKAESKSKPKKVVKRTKR